jgi:hypothetical protein
MWRRPPAHEAARCMLGMMLEQGPSVVDATGYLLCTKSYYERRAAMPHDTSC